MIDYSKKTVPQLKALIVKAHNYMGMPKPSFVGMKKDDFVARIHFLRKAAEVAAQQLRTATSAAKIAAKGAAATETRKDRVNEGVNNFVISARARAAKIRAAMAEARATAIRVGHAVKVELNG